MLKEFAVEPALLSDWKDCRYLIEKFGFHRGRVISKFPSDWRKLVIQAAALHSEGEMNQKKVVEKLNECKAAMVSSERDYQFPENWLKSAEFAHRQRPFKAILAERNPNGHHEIIAYDDLSEDHPLFTCPRECFMPRDVAGYVEVCHNLLKWSTEVIFVDPRFTSFGRWMEPLKVMLKCVSKKVRRIRYCTTLDHETSINGRSQELRTLLPQAIPSGQSLEVVILEKTPGQDTHNRYILTERGGLKFPWGLDVKQDGSKDTVNLMAKETHLTKFEEYSEPERFGYSVAARFTVPGVAFS